MEVPANILKKQSWIADKGWSSSLGVGCWLTTPRPKNNLVTKIHRKLLIWTDYLDKDEVTGVGGNCIMRSNLYSAPNVIRKIKSRMRWAEHVAQMGII
jgi:hypothetical protein